MGAAGRSFAVGEGAIEQGVRLGYTTRLPVGEGEVAVGHDDLEVVATESCSQAGRVCSFTVIDPAAWPASR